MGVLLVEDHQELAETVSGVLRGEGITADVARDGQAALDRSTVNGYDVIVLDRDLPGVHGDKICRALVAGRSQSRVLTLTAAGSIEDPGRRARGAARRYVRGTESARHDLPADDAEPHRHRPVRAPQLHRSCCTARSGPEPSMARMCRG